MTHPDRTTTADPVDAFIHRWQGRECGQERANYGLFLIELCDVLDLPRPEPAGASSDRNDYVFERAVKKTDRDGAVSYPRIDLYRRGCFILEAKQSRLRGARNEIVGQLALPEISTPSQGRRSADRAWDVLMVNARQQAEAYVPLLPVGHEPPPFLIVCDVGHCFEVYANFRRDGKVYDQFPDRRSFRIYLDDLRQAEVRDRLRAIWTEPLALDPARHSARVTRAIAERLAAVSKALEVTYPAEDVAMFLMRCLFTMFAEDVGLLPEASFKTVLERCEADTKKFVPMVGQLWEAMDKGGFAYALEANVRCFNGAFFKQRKVLPRGDRRVAPRREPRLARRRSLDLRHAARTGARPQGPPPPRRPLYAARLRGAARRGDRDRAAARRLARRLCDSRTPEGGRPRRGGARQRGGVPRPALRHPHPRSRLRHRQLPLCALELMKRLEGEVLEALAALGGQEALSGLEGHTVDPHQFLGLEINPRAAAIAELVLWIGHLQWHVRTRGGLPGDPVLKAFRNITVKDAVLEADKVLAKDASGRPITRPGPDGTVVETYEYRNPRRPEWPTAEFIVGNPPFMGGKDLRARLGDAHAEALWKANRDMNDSADFVMYWWDRAAELLTRKGTALRRFGFVTTNSISQVFQRRVLQRHLSAKTPVSIVMAVPDHPWTKLSPDAAAVRIAMTVCVAGKAEGVLREVVSEAGLDTDAPMIAFDEREGIVNGDLTVGVDVTAASPLMANEGLCSPGVKLHGAGFIVSPTEARHLGLGRREGLERHIRPYRNGRDLTARSRNVMVIDLFGLSAEEARVQFPEVYQHLLQTVKPERDDNNRESYRAAWWIFGEPRRRFARPLTAPRFYRNGGNHKTPRVSIH